MKPNSKTKTYHLSEQTCKQIAILADESGESATAIVEQAVNYLYQKDTIPENMILAQLSSMSTKIDRAYRKQEAFFSLSRFIIQYFIAALPDMFETKETTLLIKNKGEKNLKQIETLYKRVMVKTNISFMQEVFADLQTHLEMN